MNPKIDIEEIKEVTDEGWCGKPKGMKQILWERGLLDPDLIGEYKEHPPKDVFENLTNELSYRYLLECCEDFQNEETQLEYIGRLIGVKIELSPKGHPEISAYGVEYSWGFSKRRYRKKWSCKEVGQRTGASYLELLHEVLDNNKNLNKKKGTCNG